MIVLIDNYDSFTHNLVHLLSRAGVQLEVVNNDALTVDELLDRAPTGLVLSPGPGRPDDAGITLEAIAAFAGRVPILGVCLGHQAIAQAFGAKIVRASERMHGRTSAIAHDEKGLFSGMKLPLVVMRYHSLVVDPETVPDELEVTSRDERGAIMGLRHRVLPLESVQFHPESFLSEEGEIFARNFVHWLCASRRDR